ncbi:MAG: hypothetical protein F6K36_05070 [Symploca sp. SIO3C6]|nr:hypothetical protein [Symploca sp. SIO3C6]
MAWKSYSTTGTANIDQTAQKLVLNAKKRNRDSLNQGFKMRENVAYGLERFWGEHLRLQIRETEKSLYWKETWDALVEIMSNAGIPVPNNTVDVNDTPAVEEMAHQLWQISREDQRLILAVLSQLCDAIVWWTQRYKGTSSST